MPSSPISEEPAIRVCLLGPFEIIKGDQVVQIGGPGPQRLLLRLALDLGKPVSRDVLIDSVWSESLPKNPERDLSALLSRLCTRLGDQALTTTKAAATLTRSVRTDLDEYERLIEQSLEHLAAGSWRDAEQGLSEAGARLRRGRLGAPHGAEFLAPDVARVEALAIAADEAWLEALLAAGDTDRAVAEQSDSSPPHRPARALALS